MPKVPGESKQIKVGSITSFITESKSISKLMAFLSHPKGKQWECSSMARKKSLLDILAPPWCPSPSADNREGTAPGHLPFSGFPASPGRRAAASFPPQAGSQGQAGSLELANYKTAFAFVLPGRKQKQSQFWHRMPWPQACGRGGGSSVLPPTQSLLCQQHRGALTLPLSRDRGELPVGLLGFKVLQNIWELI